MYYQYDLKSRSGFDTVYLTCWLSWERKLVKGERLTLKDYPRECVWEVNAVGSEGRETPPDTRWKVGGLN